MSEYDMAIQDLIAYAINISHKKQYPREESFLQLKAVGKNQPKNFACVEANTLEQGSEDLHFDTDLEPGFEPPDQKIVMEYWRGWCLNWVFTFRQNLMMTSEWIQKNRNVIARIISQEIWAKIKDWIDAFAALTFILEHYNTRHTHRIGFQNRHNIMIWGENEKKKIWEYYIKIDHIAAF